MTSSLPGEPERPTREDLDRAILGDLPNLTLDEALAQAGREGLRADLLRARLLWSALGLPDPHGGRAFTAADGVMLSRLVSLVSEERLDLETVTRLTRAIGATMARLADWQVATMSELIAELEASGRGTGSRIRTGIAFIDDLQQTFEAVMTDAWRRHLAAAVDRVEALGAAEADLHTMTLTVGFADLVSFTRLTNGLDEDRLGDLVENFESACNDLVTAGRGRVIKTLGDSVLYVAPTPRTGVDIACDIVERVGGDPALPDVHVGLATGPVALRLGDVFGPSVNLASRLTGVARRNRVLCDSATAAAMRGVEGYVARPMTERAVRGFGTVQPFTLRRQDIDGSPRR